MSGPLKLGIILLLAGCVTTVTAGDQRSRVLYVTQRVTSKRGAAPCGHSAGDLRSRVSRISCEHQRITLECGGLNINVVSANYGRRDRSTCSSGRPTSQVTNTKCIQPSSLLEVARSCDGKTTCSVLASNSVFSDPCGGTFKYLNVSYTCTPSVRRISCEHQRITLDCGGLNINVVSANYGRRDRSTCSSGRPTNQVTNTKCIQPSSLSEVARRCDGKTTCSVLASNSVFSDPCGGTFKYLDVSYTCTSSVRRISCEHQRITLDCGGLNINVVSANYGRRDRSTCSSGRPISQVTNTKCIQPSSLSEVARRCDGKTTCSVLASNSVFSDPCGGTFKYLNVSYTCTPSVRHISCEHQRITLDCGGLNINVVSANYGRRDRSTCSSGRPTSQVTNTKCIQPSSLSEVARRCDGKTTCSVLASNSVFSDPCGGTFKYLDVSYTCTSSVRRISCEHQRITLDCGGLNINVVSANYGRRDRSTCSSGRPTNQVTNTKCIQPSSLSEVARRCDGKTTCSVLASNSVFTDPCGGTFKYLNVSYTCTPSDSPLALDVDLAPTVTSTTPEERGELFSTPSPATPPDSPLAPDVDLTPTVTSTTPEERGELFNTPSPTTPPDSPLGPDVDLASTVTSTTPEERGELFSTPSPATPSVLKCGRSLMQVGLSLAQLEAAGLDPSSAHLADRLCSPNENRYGTVWYRVERTEGTCGNNLRTNGTHAIYSNTLFIYPVRNVTLVPPLNIPFSCYYSLETETSLTPLDIRPYLAIGGGLSGSGPKDRASMSLFRSAKYTEAYPAGRVNLTLGSVLYVGVSVEEMEKKRFVVVLENCYATHSINPADLEKYFLIQHQCPTDRHQVTMSESGSSLNARFSALLFLFQGDYREVFLHCSLSLCDQKSSSCRPKCSGRTRRSVPESLLLKTLTIGPITWDQTLE